MKRLAVLIFSLLSLEFGYSQCLIFTASDRQNVLVGNNEDYFPTSKRIWVTPSKDGKYGTILFGFYQGYDNYEGGVNSKGLFIDAAAIPETGWNQNPDKETVPIEAIFNSFLENCKDLNDVKIFAEKYNYPSLKWAQFLFVDKNGMSGVLLWHENKQKLVLRELNYQVIANSHYLEKPDPYSSDVRGLIAQTMLQNSDNFSIEGFKKILFATHNEGNENPTAYSNIYDLKNMKIYLFNFYNFSEPYIIDINKILSKGKQTIEFRDIFKISSLSEIIHYSNVLITDMVSLIEEKGVAEVLKEIKDLEKQYLLPYGLSGDKINTLGYRLLGKEMIQEAIEVFIYNTEKFPANANVWDSLAEAYLKAGKKELAIKNYEKSLQLEPRNQNAAKTIKRLKEQNN